jgi:hypothetical protein
MPKLATRAGVAAPPRVPFPTPHASVANFWKHRAAMSESSSSRAADLAAQQVETIVSAAQAAAEQIKEEARHKAAEERHRAEREAERIREEARRDVEQQADLARKEAVRMSEEARKRAAARVQGAQEAADEALAEARAVTTGLRRLGESLSSQADRILRDVQAAHRRISAELRVGPAPAAAPEPEEAELLRTVQAAERARRSDEPRRGVNPIADFDVPTWVEPES